MEKLKSDLPNEYEVLNDKQKKSCSLLSVKQLRMEAMRKHYMCSSGGYFKAIATSVVMQSLFKRKIFIKSLDPVVYVKSV